MRSNDAAYNITIIHVKLNNPLMGTETCIGFHRLMWRRSLPVKLNNPLMGTETLTVINFVIEHILFHVKLNNPLMGTETRE